jgi:hypothetical protein
MKILAFERELPGASASQFEAFSRAEARRAWELYQAGPIRELYFRADQSTAVLVLECPALDDARAALSTLPFFAAGVDRI